MIKFKLGDRVAAYGTDEATIWFATGNTDPYRVTGKVIRCGAYGKPFLYKIEIDNSGSQDSEGHNAIVVYHEKQLEVLK
jgi:hypothetical protein